MRIAVLGAGAWGTALGLTLSQRHPVMLWTRDAAHYDEMAAARENRRYLPGFAFPDGLHLTRDSASALAQAELAIIGAPVVGLRASLRLVGESGASVPVVWLCKGFEAGDARLPHEIAQEELPAACRRAALSGPSFAQEVAAGVPAAVTLASPDLAFASTLARSLHGGRLRIYASDDLVGVEVGGAVKNVIAIAAGISDGLHFGESARAALVTRGLAEITRLGVRLGGRLETFMGLSGVGDLILTCTGSLSRNRRVGLELAAGKPLERILNELGHVAEGVHSAREVRRLAQRAQVDMPITDAVCKVLFEGLPAAQAVELLLAREPAREHRT
ncbi:MAG TPA: NAD(P)H-dependent glycerol-3-phosphate dehydrogenase [Burkholderiales bacterium]|nr:NAD(P)H-dependent glycerol-3-phosphate dehydrogenase [Burkholderiales bacterium]